MCFFLCCECDFNGVVILVKGVLRRRRGGNAPNMITRHQLTNFNYTYQFKILKLSQLSMQSVCVSARCFFLSGAFE